MRYKNIFFDLDHTLWDADANSAEVINELFYKYRLGERGVHSLNEFLTVYKKINEAFWEDYANGRINKYTLRYMRFFLTLQHFAIKNYDLSYALSEEYVTLTPDKSRVQPHTHEVLEYLSDDYTLHIITNGFEDAQFRKLKASGLERYFRHIITSERAGSKKPAQSIFEYSVKLSKGTFQESIMIGDNLKADIIGARSAGMDQVFYNLNNEVHKESLTYEIRSLLELKNIF